MTAASVSAGTDVVLRRCDLSDPSRTVVESKSNRSCNHGVSEVVMLALYVTRCRVHCSAVDA